MQWILFWLILMGQCSFFTCHLFEYHFVKEGKKWNEAQAYCREKYTDLATVYDMTDMERLSAKSKPEAAWIGLRNNSQPRNNRTWHWSLPGVEFQFNKTLWHTKEPNDKRNIENCVRMDKGKLRDDSCASKYKFICYNETNPSNDAFQLIHYNMTWSQAQMYCRENHTDLVSGYDQLKNSEFKSKFQNHLMLWIGLFRDTWRWSDGSNSSFRNWDQTEDEGGETCAMCDKSGKWSSGNCNENKPFFCYEDNVILIKKNKTWDEALDYCRNNHGDLAAITNLSEQRWIQERAKNASSPFVWLGLRYTCTLGFWFWVSDEVVNYKNWASDVKGDDCDMSGAMDRGGEHKWFKRNDTDKFNFFCYKDPE